MTTVEERLARIEATQKAQNERLDRIVDLMERTIRLEERHDQYSASIARLGQRVEILEGKVTELSLVERTSGHRLSTIERALWLAATGIAGTAQYWIRLLGGP